MNSFIRKVATPITTVIFFISTQAPVLAAPGDEEVFYFLTDHLGSVDVVLDEEGNVVERRDYLPYGQDRHMHKELDAPDTDIGFTGQRSDSETGLYYYGARYYDPVTGRFTSIDPLVLDEAKTTNEGLMDILENPQKLNAYTYALNNPVKYIDPEGEAAQLLVPLVTRIIHLLGRAAIIALTTVETAGEADETASQTNSTNTETNIVVKSAQSALPKPLRLLISGVQATTRTVQKLFTSDENVNEINTINENVDKISETTSNDSSRTESQSSQAASVSGNKDDD